MDRLTATPFYSIFNMWLVVIQLHRERQFAKNSIRRMQSAIQPAILIVLIDFPTKAPLNKPY